tara:strand:+ start:6371 stop:7861 length:1491 start_codon:yes stop_codon:yes gene_type:complete
MTSNKTLNLIKYYSVDSVNVGIFSEDFSPILQAVLDGTNTFDNLLNKKIYPHLQQLGINPHVEVNPHDFNYDLLVIDNNNLDFTEKKLQESLDNNIDVIFVNKIDGLTIPELAEWKITEEEECYILEYSPEEYENNDHKNIYHFYELMAGVHDILDNANINYFLIKSSCLGAVRNRNHIVYSDYIHIGCPLKDKQAIRELINNSQYFNFKDDKIHLTEEVYIKISFDPDVTDEELGDRKIYSYGPVKAYSLENPIPYLIRVFGKNVFKELVSSQLSQPIKSPKRLYDCYYNSWSAYTSRFFRKELAKHLKEVTDELSKQGIKWWIDCGTLLGAVRNGRIPLFDDDADIGIFQGNAKSTNNHSINFLTNFNPMDFYAGNLHRHVKEIEEINYMFASKQLTATEFREYTKKDNKYISAKDNLVSDAHGVPDLVNKRAVDEKFFDKELEEIKLEGYTFKCPTNPHEYVTQKSRYGKDCINGNPIRNGKPGGDVLRDDFI